MTYVSQGAFKARRSSQQPLQLPEAAWQPCQFRLQLQQAQGSPAASDPQPADAAKPAVPPPPLSGGVVGTRLGGFAAAGCRRPLAGGALSGSAAEVDRMLTSSCLSVSGSICSSSAPPSASPPPSAPAPAVQGLEGGAELDAGSLCCSGSPGPCRMQIRAGLISVGTIPVPGLVGRCVHACHVNELDANASQIPCCRTAARLAPHTSDGWYAQLQRRHATCATAFLRSFY